MKLNTYSLGMGDRFGHEADAQLEVVRKASELGVDITPVWNKSHREHTLIGSSPENTRLAAEKAVKQAGWAAPWFVDADHITLKTVPFFIESCNFFTIDVADYIGQAAAADHIDAYLSAAASGLKSVPVDLWAGGPVADENLRQIAEKYLLAVEKAAEVYRYIVDHRSDNPVIEVSMDETDIPQSPEELYFILDMISRADIRCNTIAPRFSGYFYKGVNYVGDTDRFAREFDMDVLVIGEAVKRMDLPKDLKLSVHSGSDKFSLYPLIRTTLRARGAGLHLKTAGTTWLEELIGLAESGKSGAELVREIYAEGYQRREELCKPYASVVNISDMNLPVPEELHTWDGNRIAAALRHDGTHPDYNSDLRQLLHVSFKLAAAMGDRYIDAIEENHRIIAKNVTDNLFERHVRALFL